MPENAEKPKTVINEKYFYKRDGTKYIRDDVAKDMFTPKKRKMQFSQKVCVFGLLLITATLAVNSTLLWFGREPMSDLAITVVTVFGGFATGGYFALSGVRDCSLNRLKARLHDDNFEV